MRLISIFTWVLCPVLFSPLCIAADIIAGARLREFDDLSRPLASDASDVSTYSTPYHHNSVDLLATIQLCFPKKYCAGNSIGVGVQSSAVACANACKARDVNFNFMDWYFQGSFNGKCYCGKACGSLIDDGNTNTYAIDGVSVCFS